jgi:tetratricopeptide (TPR) repeat protein
LNNSVKIIVAFIGLFLLVGCSTKKDAFLNRNFHSINTKYNILYNGNEAFKQGFEQLTSNYEDNYWEILPIEPLKVDELALPGAKRDEDSSPQAFEKAEEKAVKAVQKHSMLIARQERNKQIDDAYLLLGKSRYYSKRFVPALEAFNYVILNYPRANLINETKIWQAKTYIRLRNEEQAIENLKTLLKSDNLNQTPKPSRATSPSRCSRAWPAPMASTT